MTNATEASPQRPRLPFTVYALAGVMLLKASLLLLVVAGATLEHLRPILGLTMAAPLLDAIQTSEVARGLLLAFAALLALSAIGVLMRRRTAWLLAMVITGLFVALDIYGFINNSANHLWMLLNILTVFYLNQRDVREAVGAAVGPSADDAPVLA